MVRPAVDIARITVAERLQLLQELWASLASRPEAVPLADAQLALVAERRAEHGRDPEDAVSWEMVRAEALADQDADEQPGVPGRRGPGAPGMRRRRLAFRAGALAKVREARRHYEEPLPGLERRLVGDVDATLRYVVGPPEMFPSVEGAGRARRALLGRFSYSLVSDVDPEAIVVLTCVHHRPQPSGWQAPRR